MKPILGVRDAAKLRSSLPRGTSLNFSERCTEERAPRDDP